MQKEKQMQLVTETIIEGIEKVFVLLKNKNEKEATMLLSTVVDGAMEIQKAIKNDGLYSLETEKMNEKMNEYMLLIIKKFEKKELVKTMEIIQFSLLPTVKKFYENLSQYNSEAISKNITIGVYTGVQTPLELMPENRVLALINEGKKQNANLIFFSLEGIDINKKTVKGEAYIEEKWKKVSSPYPSVIHNPFPNLIKMQTQEEKELKKKIPFTTFGIGDKLNVPKKLIEANVHKDLLVPFKVIYKWDVVVEFLKRNNKKAVIKPLRGNQGKHVYFVYFQKNNYVIRDHKKNKIYSLESFKLFINKLISSEREFIIQKYIESKTINKKPYDIRAHVQKNGQGKWSLTRAYARIGDEKSILSNISRGGTAEELQEFLCKQYGTSKGTDLTYKIQELSLDIAWNIDKLYGAALDELGLDLAIDDNEKIWLHEINGGPQTSTHEELRAVNVIAYAKYLYKNGLFLTNQFEKSKSFNALNSKLPLVKQNGKLNIGMLTSKIINDSDEALKEACAYVAKYEDVNFYWFTEKDIDFDNKKVKGVVYENHEWIPKIMDYPDTVIDRLRLKGMKGYEEVYDTFNGKAITSEVYGNSINKLEVYNYLDTKDSLKKYLIPYAQVKDVKTVFEYIQRYNSVILKPQIGSFGRSVLYISSLKNGNYQVIEKDQEYNFSSIKFKEKLLSLIKTDNFIVQKYIQTRTVDSSPFDIRIHIIKDGAKEWSITKIYPRIGIHHAIISSTSSGGYIGGWKGFIKRNYPNHNFNKIDVEVKKLALKIAEKMENSISENFNEVGIDLALDQNLNPYVIEVNINKPGIINYEFDVAKRIVPYSISLAKAKIENTIYKEAEEALLH